MTAFLELHGVVKRFGGLVAVNDVSLSVEQGLTVLLVEQNAQLALQTASYGYIIENGRIVLDGPAETLRSNHDVQEFYLGFSGGERRSMRDVKHYKRRKRWLS